MTNQTAAKILRTENPGDSEQMELAKQMGARALDKQEPREPIEDDDRLLCCPTCLGPVTNYWAPGTTPKHCQFCGQALDWDWEGVRA